LEIAILNTRDLSFGEGSNESPAASGAVPREALAQAGYDVASSAGVFIGVRHFTTDESLKEIPFAVDDAVDMAHHFSTVLGLLAPQGVSLCLSGKPQKSESLRRLEELRESGARVGGADFVTICKEIGGAAKRAKRDGALFCSVATHGFQDPRTGLSYILASDSFEEKIDKTALTLPELESDLGKTNCPRRFLLIDSCREYLHRDTGLSARDVGTKVSEGIAAALSKFEGTVVLSATGAGGLAYDDDELKNGVFTRGILEGLGGGAHPDPKGIIRAEHVARFANEYMARWVEREERRRQVTLKFNGIQANYGGEGSMLPLAIRPEAYAAALKAGEKNTFQGQRQSALALLEEAAGWAGFSDEIVAEVSEAIMGGSREEQLAILKRFERLAAEREDYAEDFVAWWQRRRGGTSSSSPSHSGVRPALPPFERGIEVDLDTIVTGGYASVSLDIPGIGLRRMEVRVPRWTAEGEILRVPREGPGGADIHLVVRHVAGHRFRIEEETLTVDLSVSVVEAFGGVTKVVALPNGDGPITIPRGSQDGSIVLVKGQGLRSGELARGDLRVRLKVESSPTESRDSDSSSSGVSLEQLILWRPTPGGTIPDRKNWRVVEKLGEGGFGEAWLIEQPKSLQKRVLKFCFNPDHVATLRREVSLLRTMFQNPGSEGRIVKVLDWSLDQPPYFLEFEYYPAGSLVDFAKKLGGLEKIPFENRLHFMLHIAGALNFAHSQRIIHRDLKPSNVLIEQTPDGGFRALLADFGIGKLDGSDAKAAPGVTLQGFTKSSGDELGIGSRLYLAPELLENKPPTIASDIYAFGITFFQVMAGDLNRAIGHGWEQYIKIPELIQIVELCIYVNPAERVQEIETICNRLEYLLKQADLQAGATVGSRWSKDSATTKAKLPLAQRLMFWKKRKDPAWVSGRRKSEAPKKSAVKKKLGGVWRRMIPTLADFTWLLPVALVVGVLFLVAYGGQFLFRQLILIDINNEKDPRTRAEAMSNFLSSNPDLVNRGGASTPAGSESSRSATPTPVDPNEQLRVATQRLTDRLPGYIQTNILPLHERLVTFGEQPGTRPTVTPSVVSAKLDQAAGLGAQVKLSVPKWISDPQIMYSVSILNIAGEITEEQYHIGLLGNKDVGLLYDVTWAADASGVLTGEPTMKLVGTEKPEDWAALVNLLADLKKYPDSYFQARLPLSKMLGQPELFRQGPMRSYLKVASESIRRHDDIVKGQADAKEALKSIPKQLESYGSMQRSASSEASKAEYGDNISRLYKKQSELNQKLVRLASQERSAEIERDLCLMNLANYMVRRFPAQTNEVIAQLLRNKNLDPNTKREAEVVLSYSRTMQGGARP
jgi:serine/threonine protein kinase